MCGNHSRSRGCSLCLVSRSSSSVTESSLLPSCHQARPCRRVDGFRCYDVEGIATVASLLRPLCLLSRRRGFGLGGGSILRLISLFYLHCFEPLMLMVLLNITCITVRPKCS